MLNLEKLQHLLQSQCQPLDRQAWHQAICFYMVLGGQAMIFHQFLLLRAFGQMSTQAANQISPWWYPSLCFQNAKASFSSHLLVCDQHLGSHGLFFLFLPQWTWYIIPRACVYCSLSHSSFYCIIKHMRKLSTHLFQQELLPIQTWLWVSSWGKGSETLRGALLKHFSTRIWTSLGCVLQGDIKNLLPCLP